jgi:hypothetical protein
VALSSDSATAGATPEDLPVFHIELRQFPHNVCHFNMTAAQLDAAVLDPWARDRWIEMGDRKWSPHQAKLTVIESRRIPVEELSMGRGWRTAQREGHEVTVRVLAAARERIDAGAQAAPSDPGRAQAGQASDGQASAGHADRDPVRVFVDEIKDHEASATDLLADSLGLELLSRLGEGPAPLRRAWELARSRHPEHSAGECLVLAERAIVSLLRSRLVALVAAEGAGGLERRLDEVEAAKALLGLDIWSATSSPNDLMLRKA